MYKLVDKIPNNLGPTFYHLHSNVHVVKFSHMKKLTK